MWKFVKAKIDESTLPDVLAGWWLEDVNGGDGIPSEEELDPRHVNGYQYETDDDL